MTQASKDKAPCIWRAGCANPVGCTKAECCLGIARNRETTDYGLTPKLAAVRMALNAYDGNEARTIEEIIETLRPSSDRCPTCGVQL